MAAIDGAREADFRSGVGEGLHRKQIAPIHAAGHLRLHDGRTTGFPSQRRMSCPTIPINRARPDPQDRAHASMHYPIFIRIAPFVHFDQTGKRSVRLDDELISRYKTAFFAFYAPSKNPFHCLEVGLIRQLERSQHGVSAESSRDPGAPLDVGSGPEAGPFDEACAIFCRFGSEV